ncbi:MAG: helix-turn-helix domain-containing protein [Polaromonas sp.]
MSDFAPVLAGHSDAGGTAFGFSSSQSAAAQEPTAGALLREAREAAGLHIAALAVLLKVPVKKLEALEQDQFDLLPDVVFARALASSVCRTLKLDPAFVLERLPQTSAPKLTSQGAGINTPFRSPADGPGPSLWAQVSRPAVLAGLALLLGALVLIFLPAITLEAAPGKPEAQAHVEPAKSLSAAGGMAGAGLVDSVKPVLSTLQAGEPVAAASTATTGGLPATEPFTSAAPVPVQAPVFVPAPAPTLVNSTAALSGTASPALQTAPTGIVTFRARGESWVEVTDAKGTVVLRRTLSAGDVAGASGALPLTAVVGKADATQVQVRGQAFDLAAVARNNVARFEVK